LTEAMNGVLVIDKPEGKTSFDVVAEVRRALRVKKAGHTGTLDPMATGVLPVCVGAATRLVPFLTEGDKEYVAEIRLGATTDTQDRTGKIIAEAPVGELSRERMLETLERFRGRLEQVPPMYSAVRVGGKRLYELARKGVEVERAARTVVVHEIELLALESPLLRIRVRCSKGTYVRTLAHDLGETLGCHAHLTALRRTASGPFTLAQAIPLAELRALPREELVKRLVGDRDALAALPEVVVGPTHEARIRQGQRLTATDLPALGALAEGTKVRLTAEDGRVLAIAEWRGGVARYLRVLAGAG
jgi:tRNA pseudouridine55 synthase